MTKSSSTVNGVKDEEDAGHQMNATKSSAIPRDWSAQKRLLGLQPLSQPENPKQLVAAFLGAPNSGKSTLANSLVGRKVCSVSKRVDTTLHKTLAVSTEGDTQLILFDTPGIVDPYKKKHYNDSLLRDPHTVLSKADIIVVVVDLGNKLARKALYSEIIKGGCHD
jgi:ribosome biogenesis GTPase A